MVKSWLDNDSPHFEVFEHETLRNGHGPKIRTNFAKYSTLFLLTSSQNIHKYKNCMIMY